MFTNGFSLTFRHSCDDLVAAIRTFNGAGGFRSIAEKDGKFTYKRHVILPDKICISLISDTRSGTLETRIMGMLAPDPVRNWFFLDRPMRDVSTFSTALHNHIRSTLSPSE